MSIVCRGRNRNRSGAPHVGMAQLVRQLLQLVSLKPGVANYEMVMTGVCVGRKDRPVLAEIPVLAILVSGNNWLK